MIQRIQTIWLLLIVVFSALLIGMPVVEKENLATSFPYSSISILIENALIAILSFITIFLYKNRAFQIKMCYLVLVLTFIMIGTLAYDIWNSLQEGITVIYRIPIAFPVLILILDFLAIHSIKKDEKIVRSLDRLR